MQLTSLSLALSRIAGGWSPISLFAAGEQGAWYQPSDLSTLFQDAAGTTPVTAVEQRVGLMLDKSKGLALSNELAVNSDFASATGWTLFGSASISGNILTLPQSAVSAQYAYQTITTVAGKWYKYVVNTTTAASRLIIRAGSTTAGSSFDLLNVGYLTTSGTFTYYFLATTATTTITVMNDVNSSGPITVSLISLKQLPGNHAFQATTTPNDKRPILSARVNLLTSTTTSGAWAANSNTTPALTDNQGIAPDGSNTAVAIPAGATGFAQRNYTTPADTATYTVSFYIKSIDGTGQLTTSSLGFSTGNIFSGTIYDFVSGTAGVGWSVVPVGNSWFRASINLVNTAKTIFILRVDAVGAAGKIILAGPDLRPSNIGNNIPAYQRVNTATDYDTAGFPLYLKADGTYTSMSTNSINFSATDKMTVVSGVRKLSDANLQFIFEFSTDINSINGSFAIAASYSGTPYKWAALSRGTITVDPNTNNSAFTAPNSNVLTEQASISTPLVNLRANGAQVATSSASQGTGNYGNYPFYLFARNNTQYFLNGYFYGAIIRGATTSGNDLISTESYMNNQSGGLY